MFKKLNLSKRINELTGEFDSKSDLFINEIDMNANLGNFNILHFGIDTLKQKFKGNLNEDYITNLILKKNTNFKLDIEFLNNTFIFSKAPRDSGYRFLIKNTSLGIHCFFGSYHKVDFYTDGLAKVEFSPQIIHEQGIENIYYIVQEIGETLFNDYTLNGVEGHIACDIQGWKPEQMFMENVTSYSKVKRCFNTGYSVADSMSEHSIRYSDSESFLFGKAGGSQLAVYNKTTESKKTGKIKWWETVYQENPLYRPNEDVYRVELRLHDSVVKNLGDTETELRYEITDVMLFAQHTSNLWKYGLYKLYRYHYNGSTVVRPEWQKMAEDIEHFNLYSTNEFFYKRVEKEVMDTTIEKNLQQMIGHLSSAFAKANIDEDKAIEALRNLPVYKHINILFSDKGMSKEWWENEFLIKYRERKEKFAYMIENPFKKIPNYTDCRDKDFISRPRIKTA